MSQFIGNKTSIAMFIFDVVATQKKSSAPRFEMYEEIIPSFFFSYIKSMRTDLMNIPRIEL